MGAESTLSIKYSDVWDRKSVTAYVCGDCGYTELYVEKPQVVWENYNKSRKGTKE
jgi:predicted nucleic-acid-binding Zn-ribbon protein